MTCSKSIKWIIEINAPANEAKYLSYYEKIKPLFNYTTQLSLTSKPNIRSQQSGYECNFKFCRFLLNENPSLEILFHLTCFDLNKENLFHRLNALKYELNIKKLLLITGDDYDKQKDENKEIYFVDSNELAEFVLMNCHNDFESIAVGGYPGGNGRESLTNFQECQRLNRKLTAGIDTIYTQCLFSSEEFREFYTTIRQSYGFNVDIIPSVAVFRNQNDLKRIQRLTRSANNIKLAKDSLEKDYSNVDYITKLCSQLNEITSFQNKRSTSIDLCTFGNFDIAKQVLSKIS